MKRFEPNIETKGRIIRGVLAIILIVGALAAFSQSRLLALLLGLSGVFVAFEALRGWCGLRACGIKTKF